MPHQLSRAGDPMIRDGVCLHIRDRSLRPSVRHRDWAGDAASALGDADPAAGLPGASAARHGGGRSGCQWYAVCIGLQNVPLIVEMI